MHTKVRATILAAKLRKRRAELEKQREKDVKAYRVAVEKWRKDMVAWIGVNAKKRIDAVTVTELKKHESRYGRGPHFDVAAFFVGASPTPEYPSDKAIRKIAALLRQLGITGQQTVSLSTEEVAEIFGEGSPD